MLGTHLKLGVLSDYGLSGTADHAIYFPKGVWCEVFNNKGPDGCFQQTASGPVEVSPYPWDF